jgi:hypothetical protein
MNSSVTKSFRSEFAGLPLNIRALALKNYHLWQENPSHSSLQFKQIGPYWSVRVGLRYRALAREKEGRLYWFWIGHHHIYDKLISQL